MISSLRHPSYLAQFQDWDKWRLTYDGGDMFVRRYLEQFSERETTADFERRRRVTPTPNFAKSAVNEVKNSIFQRLVDVARLGDTQYNEAILGKSGGIDLHGSSMNFFIGQNILPELLVMGRVGIFTDMPPVGGTLKDSVAARPYCYAYPVEDILNWVYREPDEFQSILLRDYVEVHGTNGFPDETVERFRYMFVDGDRVVLQIFDHIINEGVKHDRMLEEHILDIPRIPFQIVSLPQSLIADIVNHQIALLNLESSDIAYALQANFPFYVEQVDSRDFSHFVKKPGESETGEPEIKVGATRGRKYGQGLLEPSFIHPSPEPLKASMEKQDKLKEDIRRLVFLAVANIGGRQSAESKALDNQGLEAGLSQIGLVLENAERKIGQFWSMYQKTEPATIQYPSRYNIKEDEDRRKDTEQLANLRSRVPSQTFQKHLTVQMARTLIGHQVTKEQMDKIEQEIMSAEANSSEPKTIFESSDRGILDLETAAKLLGYPKGTVEKAAEQHADRLARIQAAQAPGDNGQDSNPAARGLKELDDVPGDAAVEKDGERGRGPQQRTEE